MATCRRATSTARPAGPAICSGCGAAVADIDGPVHPYMRAAPGCFDLYCSLEDWKAELPAGSRLLTVQDLVDSYAAQHPTDASARNRQSVAVHLMSLCGRQERDMPPSRRRRSLGIWAHRQYPALRPPPVAFAVTAADVARADPAERPGLVAAMAVSTWEAWAVHHAAVRGFLDEASAEPAGRRT